MARRRAMLDLRSQDATRLVYELLADELPEPPETPPTPVRAKSPVKARYPSPSGRKASQAKTMNDATRTWTARADQASLLYRDIDIYSKMLSGMDDNADVGEFPVSAKPAGRTVHNKPDDGKWVSRKVVPSQPFTSLVRHQRPHISRQNRDRFERLQMARAQQKEAAAKDWLEKSSLATDSRPSVTGKHCRCNV